MRHKKINSLLAIAATAFAILSCEKEPFHMENSDGSSAETVGHDMMKLGLKLENPYTVKNMKKTIEILYPDQPEMKNITATDIYVRFLPKSEDEYDALISKGYTLLDHPLDYQILKEGDYYRDPSIDEGQMTWQYTVIPVNESLPENIVHEIIDECYIPSEDPRTKCAGIDWESIERQAYRLTGNDGMIIPATKAEETFPKGKITAEDMKFPITNENGKIIGYKKFGIPGLKIVCNSFVKIATSYTDKDGNYEMDRKYATLVRYRLLFTNELGFTIGDDKVLNPISTSTLGKGSSKGIDYNITKESNRSQFMRCTINNSMYEYIARCGSDDMNIAKPAVGLKVWISSEKASSISPMLKHGGGLNKNDIEQFLDGGSKIMGLFTPDIVIGTKDMNEYHETFAATIVEMAHASHFLQVSNEYWNRYMSYVTTSFINNGDYNYGNGTGEGAGECGIAEMWAYFIQDRMFKDKYGVETYPEDRTSWFRPQVFKRLNGNGFTVAEIFNTLNSETTDETSLENRMIRLYPMKTDIIKQSFAK